jgi:hypothetical protein
VTTLAGFFKESDTKLGIFYPNHYLVAVFRNVAAAGLAANKLRVAGFDSDEVIATDGAEVLRLAKEEAGLGSLLMQSLSRFFATEQVYTDHDVEHARHGCGFLAVYCPTEITKAEAWRLIQPEDPLDARYYGNDGIDHLAGDFKTD